MGALFQFRRDLGPTAVGGDQVDAFVGLHENYISSVERGERNVSLFNIWRIASGLGLTAADLMHGLPVRKVKHIGPRGKLSH